jgi:transposase
MTVRRECHRCEKDRLKCNAPVAENLHGSAIRKQEVYVDSTFVGVNVTSQIIEVAVRPSGEAWTTEFADESITATAAKLKYIQPKLVVLEGTGNFELPLAGVLATVGLPFAIVNTRSVREFARSVGRMSRADLTLAGLLAHFGELVNPEPRPLPDKVIEKLKDLRTRRDDLHQMLVAEKGRFEKASAVIRKDLQRHINFLEQSIATVNQEFNRTVQSSVAWR